MPRIRTPLDPARLRRARFELGLTQRQVAQLGGWHLSTVQLWEEGAQTPAPQNLVKLAGLLGVTVVDLLTESVR